MRKWLNLDSPVIRFLTNVFDWVTLNLLFILVCLPIITIPSAWGALLAVKYDQLTHPDLQIHKKFIAYFKKCFTLNSKLALLNLLVLTVLIVLPSLMNTDWVLSIQIVGVFILGVLLSYQFILISQFEVTVNDVLKNAFYLFVNYPVHTVLIIIINTLILFASTTTYMGIIIALYIFSFVGFVLLAKINAYLLKHILNKVEVKREPI